MRKAFLLATVLALAACFSSVRAASSVSFEVFYSALEPHGEWIELADYGYAWKPSQVSSDWRPYRNGRWVYTEEGWTWISNDPWGWATDHYGRWTLVDEVGWVWVPGYEWAPAWVSWRTSDNYVGWAPIPASPRDAEVKVTSTGYGSWVDSYYDLGPSQYVFVETTKLGSDDYEPVYLPRERYVTVFDETRNVTNITVKEAVVINEGPQYDVIARRAEKPIERLTIERREDLDMSRLTADARLGAAVKEKTVQVVAPRIEERSIASFKPKQVARKVDQVRVQSGWKEFVSDSQARQVREKIAKESNVPPGLPPRPKVAEESVPPSGAPTQEGELKGPGQPPAKVESKPRAPPEAAAKRLAPPGGQPEERKTLEKQQAEKVREQVERKVRPNEPPKPPTEKPAKSAAEDPAKPPTDRPSKPEQTKKPDRDAQDLQAPSDREGSSHGEPQRERPNRSGQKDEDDPSKPRVRQSVPEPAAERIEQKRQRLDDPVQKQRKTINQRKDADAISGLDRRRDSQPEQPQALPDEPRHQPQPRKSGPPQKSRPDVEDQSRPAAEEQRGRQRAPQKSPERKGPQKPEDG
jgi:hypothetical protein